MSGSLKDLDGFQALASGIQVPWNTPFKGAREALEGADVRQIEEQGLRLIRFEETLKDKTPDRMVDLQNDLSFNPDFGYGLRGVSVIIEGIGGRSHLKHEGSYAPLVEAYYRIYGLLVQRYGEADMKNHVEPDNPAPLIKKLDHTRDSLMVIATWAGLKTHIDHELQVSYAPRHILRFTAVASRLTLKNETGKGGLTVDVVFPGGHSEALLGHGGSREIELPLEGAVTLTAMLAGKSAETKFEIEGPRRTVTVKRAFWGGTLSFE